MTTAGELISMGIDHGKLCSRLFDSFPLCQLKLESLVLERAQIFADGKAVAGCRKLNCNGDMHESASNRKKFIQEKTGQIPSKCLP